MNTLLYFILFTVAFYYIFKYSVRLFMPYIMRKLAEKMMNKAQQQSSYTYTYGGHPFGQSNASENRQDYSSTQAEDKVHVDYVPERKTKRKKSTVTAGEFIDFEEVKD